MVTMTLVRKQISRLWQLLLLGVLVILSVHSAALRQLLWERLLLCLQTLIPSLFGGMAVCNLLMHTGAVQALGKLFGSKQKEKTALGTMIGVYLLSQLAGYPMGAALLRTMEQNGQITKGQAQRFSYVCFGAGPSFLIGMAGVQLLGSARAGWLLFGCSTLANLLLAVWIFRRMTPVLSQDMTPEAYGIAEAMVLSAQQAMDSLLRICAVVMLFGVLWFLAEAMQLVNLFCIAGSKVGIGEQPVRAMLAAVIDVTQIGTLCASGIARKVLLPLMAALLSFGGLSVQCQCVALGVQGLSFGKLAFMRLICALVSAALCLVILPLFPPSPTVDAFSTQMAMSRTGSFLPGLLIFCTGFPLISKKDWTK